MIYLSRILAPLLFRHHGGHTDHSGGHGFFVDALGAVYGTNSWPKASHSNASKALKSFPPRHCWRLERFGASTRLCVIFDCFSSTSSRPRSRIGFFGFQSHPKRIGMDRCKSLSLGHTWNLRVSYSRPFLDESVEFVDLIAQKNCFTDLQAMMAKGSSPRVYPCNKDSDFKTLEGGENHSPSLPNISWDGVFWSPHQVFGRLGYDQIQIHHKFIYMNEEFRTEVHCWTLQLSCGKPSRAGGLGLFCQCFTLHTNPHGLGSSLTLIYSSSPSSLGWEWPQKQNNVSGWWRFPPRPVGVSKNRENHQNGWFILENPY